MPEVVAPTTRADQTAQGSVHADFLIAHGGPFEDILGTPDISSLADLTTSYEAVRRRSPLPLSKQSVIPLALAVLVPMIAVGAAQLPVRDLLKFVSRLLI